VVKKIGFLALLLLPTALIAQSSESATGGEASFWAGAEMSSFNPDYACLSNSPFKCGSGQVIGPTALLDFDLHGKWGVEGEARWLHWHGYDGQIESNYLAGPHYRLIRYHRLSGWAKLLLGGGWVTTPGYPAAGSLKGSYFVEALGGTIDYRLTRQMSLRGDYEYQRWPAFAGPPTYNPVTGQINPNNSGLTPNGFSVGIVYKILGP
jgi:hypothetical protein